MKKVKIAVVLAAVLLTGCASTVPLASPSEDAAAKSLQAPADKSLLYVFRQAGYFGKAILFQAAVDGNLLGGIAAGTYYVTTVEPGEHTVAVLSNENQDSMKITTEPGKTHYVKVNPQLGMMTARVALEEVPANVALPLIRESKLAKGLK